MFSLYFLQLIYICCGSTMWNYNKIHWKKIIDYYWQNKTQFELSRNICEQLERYQE